MICFPKEFIATRYPGYYWNAKTLQLYSIKIQGILRPLKKIKRNHWMPRWEWHYKVYHEGKLKYFSNIYLLGLKPEKYTILTYERI